MYNLDDIENFDVSECRERMLESFEDIMNIVLDGKSASESLDMSSVQQQIQDIFSGQAKSTVLSPFAKMKLSQLMKERISGRYKDDSSGFVRKFHELIEDEID